MKHNEFIGQVVDRLSLPSRAHGIRITRATLTTLGERLQAGEAEDMAGSLPMEIDRFLTEAEHRQAFSYDEFIDRVMERANMQSDDRGDAVYHVKVIMQLVGEVIAPGEIEDIRTNLPDEFDPLFERIDAPVQ